MSAKSQKKKGIKEPNLKKKWLPIFVLVITVFLYYGNSMNNGYSLDDDLVTTTDNSVHERVEKGISAIPEIFTTHYVTSKKQRYDYRPVVTSTFAIEYEFFGHYSVEKRATVSHFINITLYAIIILLIYVLIYKILPDKKWQVPFFTALLFLIHPIHSEVVNNIKCRDELLVFVFGMLATIYLLKFVDAKIKKWWYLGFAMLLIFAGILTKTTAQIFIITIPLILYFFRDVSLKKTIGFFGVLMFTLVLARILEKQVLPDTQLRDLMYFENPLAYSDSFFERIPMFFYTNFFYLKMMMVPAPLVYYYGYDQIPIADWSYLEVWIGVMFVSLGTLVSIIRIKKKEVWSFGILFFLFGIGGAANLLFPAVGIVAERFAFIASFGLVFIAAYYGIYFLNKIKMKKGKYLFYALGTSIMLLSFTQVRNRNTDWKSRLSLYGNDIKHLPNSAKAHSLLGTEYIITADSVLRTPNSLYTNYMSYIDSAITEFKRCVEIYDGYYNAANNAGALYFTRKKDYYQAKPLFKHAIDYNSDYVEALFNYGNCFDYDLKGVKELQVIVEKTLLDSLVSNGNNGEESSYLEERKAAFAIYMIKNEVRKVLSNLNLNQPNWRDIAIYQIMLSVNTHLDVEQGLLKSIMNISAYEQAINSYINNLNPENPQRKLQEVMSFTESTLSEVLEGHIRKKAFENLDYLNTTQVELEEIKKDLIDSAVHYWNRSLEVDSTYYYSYKAFISLYLSENDFENFIGINTRAIERGGFKDDTEFYLNIGNMYNSQQKYSEAINYMEMAIAEIDDYYNQIFNDDSMQGNKKQSFLNNLIDRKKQVFGFISRIYYDKGDQENSQKYYNLQLEL